MIPMLEMHDSTCAWDAACSDCRLLHQRRSSRADRQVPGKPAHQHRERAEPAERRRVREHILFGRQSDAKRRIHTPLVIDGGNCGRDYGVLFSQGPTVMAADPDHNLIWLNPLTIR